MATITVTMTAGGNTYGRTKTIANTDLANRLIPALRAENGAVSDQQVIEAWADAVLQRTKQRVKQYETSQLSVSDLGLT